MATPAEMIIGAAQSYDTEQRHKEEQNRAIDPRVLSKLGLSQDDNQEAIDLIKSGVPPKHVAIYMRSNVGGPPAGLDAQSPQAPTSAVPGFQGGLSSAAAPAPSNYQSARVNQVSAAQGLGAQGASVQKPFTSQMLDDYVKAGGAYSKFMSPQTHETPAQRAAREQANIVSTGGQNQEVARIGAGVKQQVAAGEQTVQQNAVNQKAQASHDEVAAKLEIARESLRNAKEIALLHGRGHNQALDVAQKQLKEIRSAMVQLRDVNKQIVNPVESETQYHQLEQEYGKALEDYAKAKGEAAAEPDTSVKVKETTQQGFAPPASRTVRPQDEAALKWADENPNDPRSAAIKKKLGK